MNIIYKNKRVKVKRLLNILLCFLLSCFILTGSMTVISAADVEENRLITTVSEFKKALNNAQNGDTILVGDIDFNQEGDGAVNEAERISIDKDVTVKNGKTYGNAVFKGASFVLDGTNTSGDRSSFTFVGITFDEGLDTAALTDADWETSYSGDGNLISRTPLKCQFAIECQGNAIVSFTDCDFKSYMFHYGAAIQAYYLAGDNLSCSLELELNGCSFENNAALYGGGAIYIESNDKNVKLSAKDCSFVGNRSGFAMNSVGGGAVRLYGCTAEFEDCEFIGNVANYFYGGNRFFDYGFVPEMGGNFVVYEDYIKGGALLVSGGELSMRACTVADNAASVGGGVALEICAADIEDCIIKGNRAISALDEEHKNESYGVGSNNGIGGALYVDGAKNVTVGNTEINDNYADIAFGAIYSTYVTYDGEFYDQFSLRFLFCSILNNTCGTKMSEYVNDAGWWEYDIHAIPYIDTYGSIVIDEIYEADIPRAEEPTEDNGYNFFGNAAPEGWAEEGHLLNAPEVSTEFVKEKLGDRNYYGAFTVGANNHDVTYKFFADGECISTVRQPHSKAPRFPECEKEGYTLVSWALPEGLVYKADSPLIVGNSAESVDLHALFTPNEYKVTFELGNSQTAEIKQTFGEPLTFPEAMEREGYTFKGWFTSENGEGERIEDGTLFATVGDVTYYAFYEKDFPVLTLIIVVVGVLLAGGLIALAIIVFKRRNQPVTVIAEQPEEKKEAPDTSMLSPREKEVLTLLLEGKQRNEIASLLYISENTVKKQITSIYSKLGVTTRNELFALFK